MSASVAIRGSGFPVQYKTPPWTQVIAHRGNSGPLPENTLRAIESAVDLGVDMIEVDVRMTKDDVAVLLHDARVDDTTSGSGFVAELTLAELRTLDAGSWRGDEFADELIPTLDEVLALARGRVALNLDVKVPEAARPTVAAVTRSAMTDQVVISGCAADCVEDISEMTRDIAVLFNLDEMLEGAETDEIRTVARSSVDIAARLGAVAINVPHSLVDAALVERAHSADIGVWTFTVDDSSRFVEVMEMGVTSLTTNWPERMLPLVPARTR
ncbi:MAG: hypothetical protein IIC71_08820 [Acidobacteria bacterium]|nr:hypothetical protein [Acidobacteriota bacterium]